MGRIQACFDELKKSGRKALIPYIVAGDPDPEKTVEQMHALVTAGADLIELGVPFSDPMAEGPVIQLAHERALENKTRLVDILKMVANFREKDKRTPIVLMGYANPVEVMGYKTFSENARKAGVDGVLTVDLPPEEADSLNSTLAAEGIDTIFLIAPTTRDDRLDSICQGATGYLYYVSFKGVTGANSLDVEDVSNNVAKIRLKSELPVAVGFGIKDAESAKAISRIADGVVVGSALVKHYSELVVKNRFDAAEPPELLQSMRQAMDD